MSLPESGALHLALQRLVAEATRDPRLASEFQRARREFFGGDGEDAVEPGPAAETRCVEWYLLERESEVLGEEPGRRMLREVAELDAAQALLMESVAGVFAVENTGTPGEVVRLRDLQDSVVHEVVAPLGLALSSGDLVVGRLYGTATRAGVVSPAVAVQNDGRALGAAFLADVHQLQLDRRLTQVEIEHLLFLPARRAEAAERALPPLEHVEAQLQGLLVSAGHADHDVAEISEALRQAASPGTVIGPILDELAFETDVDLDAARRLLIDLWNAQRRISAGEAAAASRPRAADVATPSAPGLGQRLASRIEEGLERAEDLEELFAEVEAMIGDGAGIDDDAEAAAGGDVWEGDLAPLIQEYLWEEQRSGGDAERVLHELVRQQREAPVPRMNLEDVQAEDLLRLFVGAYLAAEPRARAQRVQSYWAIVEHFFRWAERTQEFELGAPLEACRDGFVAEVERIHRASLALSTPPSAGAELPPPALLRVGEVDRDGFEVLRGGDRVWVETAAAPADLRQGDLLLGTLQRESEVGGALRGLVLVLPASAEPMLGE
ncbi:MAG: hypothetical protein AAF628_03715 [Planctomycetota bacterium]